MVTMNTNGTTEYVLHMALWEISQCEIWMCWNVCFATTFYQPPAPLTIPHPTPPPPLPSILFQTSDKTNQYCVCLHFLIRVLCAAHSYGTDGNSRSWYGKDVSCKTYKSSNHELRKRRAERNDLNYTSTMSRVYYATVYANYTWERLTMNWVNNVEGYRLNSCMVWSWGRVMPTQTCSHSAWLTNGNKPRGFHKYIKRWWFKQHCSFMRI